ncbi:MAG: sigma-70 family RNA polymerase sigma factor [Saprospiraceae bacterium]|nr:sigma-70 family RNA polymerase sigma factor [Saprospiraceae bacterium]MCB9317823.1 sigma-70 family RNA polymerase sigma factor [Lewinellaceae bacterium]
MRIRQDLQTENWVLRYQAGDEKALGLLMDHWQKRIYNLAYKMVADEAVAKDILQKTFIKVYQHLHKLEEADKFRPWVYKIAVNFCNSELRKTKRTESLTDVHAGMVTSGITSEHRLEQSELKDLIWQTLGQIPEEQKAVIIMKEYEGFKFQEIADILDISINTAKSRLYYGLRSMKKLLSENPHTKAYYYEYH